MPHRHHGFLILLAAAAWLEPLGSPALAASGNGGSDWGAWSLVPPLVAIGLAIVTGRVIVSLLLSVAVAAAILHWPSVPAVLSAFSETFLWQALADEDFLRIVVFTSLMGAMVGLMHRGGGMQGLVDLVTARIGSPRGGQLAGWGLGLVVFFDDYANTLLLGTTLAPWYDRLRISRQKLAYIVDSTAAPVAGLALVSTWVAAEVGYIQQGLEQLRFAQQQANPFDLFVQTIPYRFYPLLALAMVGWVAFSGRDFGPMRRCEAAAARGERTTAEKTGAAADPWREFFAGEPPPRWPNAVLPVLVVVAVTLGLLAWTGRHAVQGQQPTGGSLWQWIRHGDAYVSLVYASLAGLLSAWGLLRLQRVLSARECYWAAVQGALQVAPALVILWLASALRRATAAEALDTGGYLAGLLQAHLALPWLPTVVFLLAAAVSFATGTSWGTMGILMPLVIQTAHAMLGATTGAVSPEDPVFLGAVAGVLAGSIFGDHCSPISDTTVLSSLASGCPHMEHVWTQLPYAVVVAVVSVVLGTLPAGWGLSPWWGLLGGVGVLGLVVYGLGHSPQED